MAELTESTIALSNFPSSSDIIQEMQELGMPESEYRHMMKSYNQSLAQIWTRLDECTASQRSLIEINDNELVNSRKLMTKLDDCQVLLQQAYGNIDRYEEMLGVEKQRQSPVKASKTFSSTRGKDQIMRELNSFLSEIQLLVHKNALTAKSRMEMITKIESVQESDLEVLMCVKCKHKFVNSRNEDKAWNFHSGKLKYYSCKGCGNDAYFTCCRLCLRCSPGCRFARHESC